VPQTRYEFRVSGRLSERIRQAFCDFGELRVVYTPPETIIYGPVVDESQWHGILALLQNLGLHVVSVHRMPEARGMTKTPGPLRDTRSLGRHRVEQVAEHDESGDESGDEGDPNRQ
jgi:hypothetical protein